LNNESISGLATGVHSDAAAAAPVGRGRRHPPRSVAWTLPGFGADVRVTTSFGDLPLHALRRRDPLRTPGGTIAMVHWCDRLRLDQGFLTANPDAQPILIQAKALGHGLPKTDILVSPHQMISVTPPGYQPQFRLARDLTGRPGILRRPEETMSYYLFHCETPTMVMVEGVAVSVSP
jgi:hypothetical protein